MKPKFNLESKVFYVDKLYSIKKWVAGDANIFSKFKQNKHLPFIIEKIIYTKSQDIHGIKENIQYNLHFIEGQNVQRIVHIKEEDIFANWNECVKKAKMLNRIWSKK